MQPITVSTTIARPIEEVFAFLDVQANHEQFNDHFMRDWRLSGPPAGPGARVAATAVLGGRSEAVAIEVVAAEAPTLIVERNVSAGGGRVATGTYRLTPASAASTEVAFDYAWERAPLPDRLLAPIVRVLMRRALTTSMQRLRAALTEVVPAG